jgi:hypothetical protein
MHVVVVETVEGKGGKWGVVCIPRRRSGLVEGVRGHGRDAEMMVVFHFGGKNLRKL